MTKYTLLTDYLQFVSLGTGKIHARENRMSPTRPQLDLSKMTMCGRTIPTGAEVRPQRTLGDDKLCGRCGASLVTYTRTAQPKVKVERDAKRGEA